MRLRDRDYALTLASDVTSDSMLLELDDVSGGGRDTIADVRYDDAGGGMTLSAYRRELPLEAVGYLIAEARRRLPPAEGAGSGS